ncbi:MAG: histidine phosphatase family protein [Oligoflexia bacterium]|nr:histidine phosphatase family protein [Oligoflexia bacterium]
MIIYLIRHGQTNANLKKIFCGYTDVKLNSNGKKEVRRLRRNLSDICDIDICDENKKIRKIYCSDRFRAIETAKILFPERRIKKLPGLSEIHLGIFEGMTIEQIEMQYPSQYREWMRKQLRFNFPEGECYQGFKRRVLSSYKQILSNMISMNDDDAVVVVTHGGTISMILNYIMKSDNFFKYLPANASVSKLEIIKKRNTKTILHFFGKTL